MASETSLSKTTIQQLTTDFRMPVPWGHVAGKIWGHKDFPSRPPVLCLHGWLDNCNTFDKLIPLLPRDFKYVAVDLPGHGWSSHISHGMFYTFIHYCSVIRRVMDYFDWNEIIIMGHSNGGNIATYFSGLYPEMAKRLIVMDTPGIAPLQLDMLTFTLRSSVDSYLRFENVKEFKNNEYTYDRAKKKLLSANPSLSEEGVDILLERGLKRENNGMYTYTRDIRLQFKTPSERDFRTNSVILQNMEADILYLWAKDGAVFSVISFYEEKFNFLSTELRKKCKIQRVTVEGGHHAHLCSPESVADHISDFLLKCTKDDTVLTSNL